MRKASIRIAPNWKTETGRVLQDPMLSYRIYGDLQDDSKPVVWVCHALTANDDPFEWWAGLFGENDLFNPIDFTIICVNMIGSCYGSIGPLSENPKTLKSYLHGFPLTTIRDNSNAFSRLADSLGLKKIDLLIGGSMGGQVALQWAVEEPNRFGRLALLATNATHSPWGIAFNQSQRMAIEADSTWGENTRDSGKEGMQVARSLALLSYRNYVCYDETQPRDAKDDLFTYRAQSYQTYQGEKIAKRFNAISYHRLSHTMDSHDISKGFGSIPAALERLEMPVLSISMEGDILFPPSEQIEIAEGAPFGKHISIPTTKGHDGFLIETERLSAVLKEFMKEHLIENAKSKYETE
jgi:homoserine O-acetyltransferase